jgi:glycosyltransferase involved in cell wall biosynthesis
VKIPPLRYKTPPPQGDDILPIIIPILNRFKLFEQTLTSLLENSYGDIYPIVIDGGSDPKTQQALEYLEEINAIKLYRMYARSGIGVCRNFGAAIAPNTHPYIYFSDADMYYTKDWDRIMINALDSVPQVGLLGAQRHPYHGLIDTLTISKTIKHKIEISDQQAGYSMMMTRDFWNQVGPFRTTSPTDIGIEDTDMCNRVRDAGKLIGALDPPVAIHTGIYRSDGSHTAGAQHIKDLISKHKHIIFE